jgi:hypothetical protein
MLFICDFIDFLKTSFDYFIRYNVENIVSNAKQTDGIRKPLTWLIWAVGVAYC